MYSVRKVKTKSGSIAIQVVQYVGHRSIIIKHIGSGKDELEVKALGKKAFDWIERHSGQLTLFPDQKQKTLLVDRADCIGVTHHFAFRFFMSCLDECELSHMPRLLLDLAIIRLIEPASKLRSIELLQHYFGIKYSQRIYRNIPKLTSYKADIEHCAYNVAQKKFKEPYYFVLYDVTTLYFESFKADDFKTQGFSKDNKSQQLSVLTVRSTESERCVD